MHTNFSTLTVCWQQVETTYSSYSSLSAHDMTNNCSLFDSLFKKNSYDIFLFGTSFFHFRDIDVFMLIRKVMTSYGVQLNCKILNKEYLSLEI